MPDKNSFFATLTDNITLPIDVSDYNGTIQNFATIAKKGIGIGTKYIEENANIINLSDPVGINHASPKSTKNLLEASGNFSAEAIQKISKTDSPFLNSVAGENVQNIYYTKEVASVSYKPKDADGKEKEPAITDGPRPNAVFNKYSLMNFRGTPLGGTRKGNSVIEYNKIDTNTLDSPTVSKIIEMTSSFEDNYGYRYNYADFALAKYFNRISNNLLVTLRRFAYPAPDDIITPVNYDNEGKEVPIKQPDIARAVTWMGPATGNDLSAILQFSHGFEWKEAEAAVQEITAKTEAASGKFGSIVNGSTFLSAAFNAASGRDAYDSAVRSANGGYDAFKETYPNHVFGPLNVIKSVQQREQGLTFNQEFTLKFEYVMRSFAGANPKIMMLDQLANILALTYNTAPFWGGAVRWIGDGSVAKPLGDLSKLRSGDYGGFLSSIVSSLAPVFNNVIDAFPSTFQRKDSKLLNNLVGGSLMKMFNSPQGAQAVQSLLTGDPTGQWHITIGNPLNPMAVIGNLICTSTKVNFEGPLGIQDFPEKMVVEISLKPGRPRDKGDIESMFNSGRGRFYLQPEDGLGMDINDTYDISSYGNKDRGGKLLTNTFRKIANG